MPKEPNANANLSKKRRKVGERVGMVCDPLWVWRVGLAPGGGRGCYHPPSPSSSSRSINLRPRLGSQQCGRGPATSPPPGGAQTTSTPAACHGEPETAVVAFSQPGNSVRYKKQPCCSESRIWQSGQATHRPTQQAHARGTDCPNAILVLSSKSFVWTSLLDLNPTFTKSRGVGATLYKWEYFLELGIFDNMSDTKDKDMFVRKKPTLVL